MNKWLALAAFTAAGYVVWNQTKKKRSGGISTATESIELDVPVSTVYNQWTQFEDFPKFMPGVLEVRQLDDTHLHWRARVGGKEEQWDAEITQQIPDRLIAWRSTSGVHNDGRVTFRSIGDDRTHIELRLDYEPRGVVENIGDALGVVNMQANGSLRRFKSTLEERGSETGAWRGTVNGGVTQNSPI